tara:strand:- start:5882 stop:6166 length:285 start_codon:yes stop_codon:yes gene_type:complete
MANKKVTLSKLIDLYQESPEARDQAEMQLEVDQASLQLTSDILATQSALSKANKAHADALRARPFNSAKVIDALNDTKALVAGLADLNDLKTWF